MVGHTQADFRRRRPQAGTPPVQLSFGNLVSGSIEMLPSPFSKRCKALTHRADASAGKRGVSACGRPAW
ncbi:hypothetical protein ACWPKS_13080 [Coraliomargarita sp. W4R72]